MTSLDRLTRLPRPFDRDLGAEAHALFPQWPAELRELAEGTGGSSPYLLGSLQAEQDWIARALPDPEMALSDELDFVRGAELKDAATILRLAKRRISLLAALADLGGIWRLEQVTGALTDFAALACNVALKAALSPLIARGKVPGMGEDDLATAAGLSILAMGKMGAGELNYSSDIDLIVLFDQDKYDAADLAEARAALVRATRAMCKTLSDVTPQGYVFRTDLRLRPDPSVTPVALSMEAAERYYESLGRTWERAAYIKAQPVAGDIEAGARFLETLTPFVWRKHLDFAAIEDAHDMRLAIRAHKGTGGPITLPGHNMKLGRGGIREIEFYTQTRQLIAGGRDASLRVRGTVEGLARLAAKDWISTELAERLSDHYRFHREVEHRVQMVRDAQTHNLPNTDAGFERLACLMGRDAGGLRDELHDRLGAVHLATEGFFAPSEAHEDEAVQVLDDDTVTRWLTYAAFRSPRAQALLDRLRPAFEARLALSARPSEALSALDGFLAGLPAGVQLLSLFEANPHLIDLVLDVAGTSAALGHYLSRNSGVLDAVIGGAFFAEWPGRDALETALKDSIAGFDGDYEACLDQTRRWMKEWHFRIGVHVLRDLVSADQAGAQYADLAHSVLGVIWPVVQREFARKHGPTPGRGAVLLGMGALGAGQMNAHSDLDLIVIYDAEGEENSDGKRPLATRPYFARLTQSLITALSAPMAEGRLYEVDMRLRPSGNQGPVATSWEAFKSYQRDEAWTWEHLALSRARVVAGPDGLAEDVEAFRSRILAEPPETDKLAQDLGDMRRRIAAAKPATDWLDIKAGPGRMQDIELLAQSGALLSASTPRDVDGGLGALVSVGALDAQGARRLGTLHAQLWQIQIGARMMGVSRGDDLGVRGRDLILRLTGATSLDALQKSLIASHGDADSLITQTLAALGYRTGNGDDQG